MDHQMGFILMSWMNDCQWQDIDFQNPQALHNFPDRAWRTPNINLKSSKDYGINWLMLKESLQISRDSEWVVLTTWRNMFRTIERIWVLINVYQREILIGWLCSLCLFNGCHLIETISNVFLRQVLQSCVGHHHAVSFLETWMHLQNILEFCASKSCVQVIHSVCHFWILQVCFSLNVFCCIQLVL